GRSGVERRAKAVDPLGRVVASATATTRSRRSAFVVLERRPRKPLIQVGPEPALRLLDRHAAASCIILELIAPDFRDSEILAVAVAEIEARNRRGRKHREILGERNFARAFAEHLEERRLKAVIRARWVTGRGADPVIFLPSQLFVRQMLLRIAPQALAHLGVEDLGEALGEAVGERLQKDVVVVVNGLLEPLEMRLEAMDPDGEATDPVLALGRDEVGETHIGASLALLHLLAKEGQPSPVVAGENEDVIAFALAAPKADGGFGGHPALGD